MFSLKVLVLREHYLTSLSFTYISSSLQHSLSCSFFWTNRKQQSNNNKKNQKFFILEELTRNLQKTKQSENVKQNVIFLLGKVWDSLVDVWFWVNFEESWSVEETLKSQMNLLWKLGLFTIKCSLLQAPNDLRLVFFW